MTQGVTVNSVASKTRDESRTHKCTQAHVPTHTHARARMHPCTNKSTHTLTLTCMWVHTPKNIYAHTYTHTHMHTRTKVQSNPGSICCFITRLNYQLKRVKNKSKTSGAVSSRGYKSERRNMKMSQNVILKDSVSDWPVNMPSRCQEGPGARMRTGAEQSSVRGQLKHQLAIW